MRPLLIALLLAASLPAFASDRLVAAPRVSSGKQLALSLATDSSGFPAFTVHPLVAVAPLAGYNLITHQAVLTPVLTGALEFDIFGYGGPAFGASGAVGASGLPNLTLSGALSFHPPQLGDLTSGLITHIVIQYQESILGEPKIRQIVGGPALAF